MHLKGGHMMFLRSKKLNVLFLVCLLIFIDAIGIGLVLPIMPKLFYSNIGLGISIPLRAINFFYSLTIAIFPLVAMIGMPILGHLSDKLGRKKVMLLGMVGLILGYLVCIIALISHSIFLFLFARMISGFSSGTYSVCYAAVMDISENESQKIEWLKYLTLVHVAGFILGPALSAFVPDTVDSLCVLTMPFLIASVISFINFILVVLLYPNYKHIEKEPEQAKVNLRQIFSALAFIFKQKWGGYLYGYILFNLGLQVYIQAQSVHLMKMYHYTTKQIGVFYIIIGISATISMFVLHPKIRSIYGAALQVKVGMFLMGLLLLLHVFFTSGLNVSLDEQVVCTWVVSILIYMASPFVALNMTSIFSDLVSKEVQGNLMGALGQIESLATVTGALLMTVFLYFGNDFDANFAGITLLIGFVVISFAQQARV